MSRSCPAAPSDTHLIAAARQGDQEAYGHLVRRYQDRLFSGMIQKTGSAADAEDVVQDAFVRAYLKLDSFRGRSSFFTWLYRIALNLLSTRRRSKRREASYDEAHDQLRSQASEPAESPTETLLRKERRQQVHEALARLSDEHRMVLLLREFEGFDYETIACLMEANIGTVRSRIHRARMALRKEINSREKLPGGSAR